MTAASWSHSTTPPTWRRRWSVCSATARCASGWRCARASGWKPTSTFAVRPRGCGRFSVRFALGEGRGRRGRRWIMRIAYVCADPGVPVFGRKGCSVHVQEMIRAFRRSGADVELFAARADDPLPPELEGVRVYRIAAVRAAAPGIAAVEVLNRALAVGLSQAAPFDMEIGRAHV